VLRDAARARYASGSRARPDARRPCARGGRAALEGLEKKLSPSRLILGGFSQGAMLATSIALETEQRLELVREVSG
jgi:predicted esterase